MVLPVKLGVEGEPRLLGVAGEPKLFGMAEPPEIFLFLATRGVETSTGLEAAGDGCLGGVGV